MQLLFILEKKMQYFPLYYKALPQLAPAHFHFTDAVAEGKAEEIQFNFFTLRTKVTKSHQCTFHKLTFWLKHSHKLWKSKNAEIQKKKKFLII